MPEDSWVRDLWLREAEATPLSCAVSLAAAPGEGKAGPPGGTQHLLQRVEPLALDWVRPRQVVQLHACAQIPSAAACQVPASCFFNILNNRLFRSARGSTSVSTLMSWLDWGKPHNWAEDSLGLRLGPTADELGDAQQVPVLTCGSSHWRLGRIGQHPFPGLASTVLGTNTPSTVRAFVVVTGIASYTTS